MLVGPLTASRSILASTAPPSALRTSWLELISVVDSSLRETRAPVRSSKSVMVPLCSAELLTTKWSMSYQSVATTRRSSKAASPANGPSALPIQ